ncbi:hypothetical protein SAV31267_005560 [Streptomyces avermitilis]|uniref:Uncharacterized protein n=1 Tax=Streptomyces avermitilis TaxID=33903 RepID=A0A4D4MGA1_STRAX|nr:hypothetical protein SAV31267_005560 [Streptomyces avermitilis]
MAVVPVPSVALDRRGCRTQAEADTSLRGEQRCGARSEFAADAVDVQVDGAAATAGPFPQPRAQVFAGITRPLPRRSAVRSRNSSGVRATGAPSTSMRCPPGSRLIGDGAVATYDPGIVPPGTTGRPAARQAS